MQARGQLVDVRSPEEYAGTRMHMPDYPNEGALRGGHIPGAKSMPWARAINPEDGTFKTAAELRKIYCDEKRLSPSKPTIAYCRIGERSSHTWFALKYLLGFDNVRNYDGSVDRVGQHGGGADREVTRRPVSRSRVSSVKRPRWGGGLGSNAARIRAAFAAVARARPDPA